MRLSLSLLALLFMLPTACKQREPEPEVIRIEPIYMRSDVNIQVTHDTSHPATRPKPADKPR